MSAIAAYYNDKSILITGATGFVGKVLMEKLFRTSPDLKVIYILVRPKSGQTLKQRVFSILNSELFSKVREIYPNVGEKIRAIYADLSKDDFGISKEDMEELLSCTNIIFHCAATVRFEDPLKYAVQLNVVATQKLLLMASQMPKLEAFIHLSTAFSNCNLKHIDEVVYPCPGEPKKIINAMEWLDDAIIKEITPKLIGDRPNTYIYSKALGETVVQEEGGKLNIAIVRPSIISSTWQEPFPGWIDNVNGPGQLNPCYCKKMALQVMATLEKTPFEKAFRRPCTVFTTNTIAKQFWKAVSHRIPAIIYDFYLRLTGRKPRIVKLMNRTLNAFSKLEYFISQHWEWSINNTEMLMSQMSPEDQRVFNFDVRQLNWLQYIENYVLGLKKHLLKEDMAGIPEAKQHLRRLRNINYIFNTVIFLIAWRLLIARSQMARNVWFFIVSLCYKFISYFRASMLKA
uniref:Fatty acyl-CoA reductase n=1 Tax=Rousettus aegyptiacus TaxID=9407 RepID=A0A7J8JFI2_ROUAE|nr:fatty acyl-CoA reductase 2 [Rousettus aegyptiacus]